MTDIIDEAAQTFPVLFSTETERKQFMALGCPTIVPWSLLAPHEAQARKNHDQSLKRLAERGGLGPSEMVAVLEDRPWKSVTEEAAVEVLVALVKEWTP